MSAPAPAAPVMLCAVDGVLVRAGAVLELALVRATRAILGPRFRAEAAVRLHGADVHAILAEAEACGLDPDVDRRDALRYRFVEEIRGERHRIEVVAGAERLASRIGAGRGFVGLVERLDAPVVRTLLDVAGLRPASFALGVHARSGASWSDLLGGALRASAAALPALGAHDVTVLAGEATLLTAALGAGCRGIAIDPTPVLVEPMDAGDLRRAIDLATAATLLRLGDGDGLAPSRH